MLKHPPDILITTPESLYLMLTSPRAREMFRTVRSVIVDEIHTLCGNKRGVHLAVSLERLCHLAAGPVQRIGLSATIKPLNEAARFLGGQQLIRGQGKATDGSGPAVSFVERQVTIVDAHYHKPLDLEVVTVVDDFRELPGESIWPVVIPRVLEDIRRHRTTLIFANNRRLAERTADRLNAQLEAEQTEEIAPGSTEALAPGGVMRDRGIFAIGASGPIRAHHGSMSKQARHEMEEDLKAGRLPALVGTSSLELGIDIGAVDLVVQLQSPKSVAQGLQRVGRSGHLVGQTSRGRIYATFREDLVEAAAIARGMIDGDVEPTISPSTPLDVLAQQIVAMVAMQDWSVGDLFDLLRQAYPYRDLSLSSFQSVLEMLAGKYYLDAPQLRPASSLRAKIAWDRVHDRLSALPGSRWLAMSNVGTIPDTGAYGVYLSDGKTKVGELDEEFVYETRVGDVFLLGSSVWRVHEIADDRIIVADAAGATPRMPFWNGDYPWRPYELGLRIGRFRRQVKEKLAEASGPSPEQEVEEWLRREYALDERSARNLVAHVSRQLQAIGVISSDRTIVVESFENAVGDPHMVIHSPFGGRVNGAWALALTSALRERTGVQVETQSNDDGIIFRFPKSDREPPFDIVQEVTAAEARERILHELPDSAVFGAQFRMNAGRALLLTKLRGRKRTPFWLQRLKARDLLALVRQFDDFPIVAETFRDCLRDVFDMPHLDQVLSWIQSGEIQVVPVETVIPSPVATGLLYNFVSVYMYEWDAPKAERRLQALSLRRDVLTDLLKGIEWSDLLGPEAIAEVQARSQHLAPGYQARTVEELALCLLELGDLTTQEIAQRSSGDAQAWIAHLSEQQRIVEITLPISGGTQARWIPVELAKEYRSAFGPASSEPSPPSGSREAILRRLMRRTGPVTREAILERYAFPGDWLEETLGRLVSLREIAHGHLSSSNLDEFCDRHILDQIHRLTLTILRKQVQPVSIFRYSDFLVRWQHAHPETRMRELDGLRLVIEQMRGASLPATVWEEEVLAARITDYQPDDLTTLAANGLVVWVGSGRDPRRGRVRFFFRGEGALYLPPSGDPDALTALDQPLSSEARSVYEYLKNEGASFGADLKAALGLKGAALDDALVELVMAGLATNDTVEALRSLIRRGPTHLAIPGDAIGLAPSPRQGTRTPLQQELASRMRRPHAITATRYRDARRRITQRLGSEVPALSSSGRWSLVHRTGIMGPPLSDEVRAEKLARLLLARYGVITRQSMDYEEGIGDWGFLYPQFQRMELRGEARRGYFIAGLPGVQFALPGAVERLREESESDAMVVLNATDPANVFGGELSDTPLRFPRVPSTHVILQRGWPILTAEDGGERISVVPGLPRESVRLGLQAYLDRRHAARRIVVSQWNGNPVVGSEGQQVLESLGFTRAPNGMERWVKL
jgi:ATP-dependent helicase Lhr and Lhr-like helicase